MATLYHVNPETGATGRCGAHKGNCPFGGSDGGSNHYESPEAANQASEALMEEKYSSLINKSYRKKDQGFEIDSEAAKVLIESSMKEGSKLHPAVVAKVFSTASNEKVRILASQNMKSQKILREMSDDESAEVRLAVANSTNNPDVLKKLSEDKDPAVREAATNNSRTPVKVRKKALDSLKDSGALKAPVKETAEVVEKKDPIAPPPVAAPTPPAPPVAPEKKTIIEDKKPPVKKKEEPASPPEVKKLTPLQKHKKTMADIKTNIVDNADKKTRAMLEGTSYPTVLSKDFDKMSTAEKEVAVVYTYGMIHRKLTNNVRLKRDERRTVKAANGEDWIKGYNNASASGRKALIKEAHDNLGQALELTKKGQERAAFSAEAKKHIAQKTYKYISDTTPKTPTEEKAYNKKMDVLASKMSSTYSRHTGMFAVGGSYDAIDFEDQSFRLRDYTEGNEGEKFMRFDINGHTFEMSRNSTGSWTEPKRSYE